jgi:hemerythrin
LFEYELGHQSSCGILFFYGEIRNRIFLIIAFLQTGALMDSLVKWDSKYDTGNYIIDFQHKRLVRLINELDQIRQHEELRPFLLKTVFEEVTRYTDYHFSTEEGIMKEVNYSEIDSHKVLHQNFINGLDKFKIGLADGTARIDSDFCTYLTNWLIHHIGVEDPKFIAEMVSGNGLV